MHRCVECEESITNPVCPDCLAQGIAAWAGEWLGPAVATAVFDVTDTLSYRFGNTNCIKCHKPMGLCTYCYTQALVGIMREHPAVLAQFLYYFSLEPEKSAVERNWRMGVGA